MNKNLADSIIGSLSDKVKDLNTTMGVIVIVLLLGFATMFVALLGLVFTYQDNSSDANQKLKDEIKVQNDKINSLTEEITNLTETLRTTQVGK